MSLVTSDKPRISRSDGKPKISHSLVAVTERQARDITNQHYARVPNGWSRLTFLGKFTPKAADLIHYFINQVQLSGDPDALIRFKVKDLARVLSPNSKRVANRTYDVVRSAFRQLGQVLIEVRFVNPDNNRRMERLIWLLDTMETDYETGATRLGPRFREYLKLALKEGWTKVMLTKLFSLRTTRQKNVFLLASSFANLDNLSARFISYAQLRQTLGMTKPYYRDILNLRREMKDLMKMTSRRSGLKIRIQKYDERGIYFNKMRLPTVKNTEQKAVESAQQKFKISRELQFAEQPQSTEQPFNVKDLYSWPDHPDHWGDDQWIAWRKENNLHGQYEFRTWGVFKKKFPHKADLVYRAATLEEMQAERAKQKAFKQKRKASSQRRREIQDELEQDESYNRSLQKAFTGPNKASAEPDRKSYESTRFYDLIPGVD